MSFELDAIGRETEEQRYEVTDAALRIHSRETGLFADQAPRLQFVSPLADGADQFAAEIHLRLATMLYPVAMALAVDRDERLLGALEARDRGIVVAPIHVETAEVVVRGRDFEAAFVAFLRERGH